MLSFLTLTHQQLYRSDLHPDNIGKESEAFSNPSISLPYEKFGYERLHHDKDEVDLVLELPLINGTSPKGLGSKVNHSPLLLTTLSPHPDLMEADQLREQSSEGELAL